jgi:aspartyl-tRNA(Asn)/glutamyl-tRNA(Gln) amidotransferase subunit C
MRLDLEEVRRVARLADLEFGEDEEARLKDSLERILEYVEKLGEIDITGVPPARGVDGEGRPCREDRPEKGLSAGEALSNAPEQGRGHFKVPRVLFR